MSIIEIKVPSPGESITEVTISRWLKSDGDYVEKDEEIAEIDSDKATLTIAAEESGALKTLAKEGDVVNVGSVVAKIDTSAKGEKKTETKIQKKDEKKAVEEKKKGDSIPIAAGKPLINAEQVNITREELNFTPLAKKMMQENKISAQTISGTGEGGKITKMDVLRAVTNNSGGGRKSGAAREKQRVKMSPLRKKLAQRLVAVKNQTAMLTTFNEVDMSSIMQLRAKYTPSIEKKSGIKLGFMSFFSKAVCEALQLFPTVNAMIDGEEIIYHKYCDIGIAVSAPKGLVVPVVRNAETLSLTEIELKIKELALKARDNKITLADMEGGTFTITNGGVFGSMMSTPILNPPQSAILGMHNIIERPIAMNGQVVIRPMMYVALSYDHRIIDGKDSVGFLVKMKEICENPSAMLFEGKDPNEI